MSRPVCTYDFCVTFVALFNATFALNVCGLIRIKTSLFCNTARYMSTLYSHPKWPKIHPKVVRNELRDNIKDNWMWLLLTPSWLFRHMGIIREKKLKGQPVSFADFFGYLVGEVILKKVST